MLPHENINESLNVDMFVKMGGIRPVFDQGRQPKIEIVRFMWLVHVKATPFSIEKLYLGYKKA